MLVSHGPDIGLTKSTPRSGRHPQNDSNKESGRMTFYREEQAMGTLFRTKIYKQSDQTKTKIKNTVQENISIWTLVSIESILLAKRHFWSHLSYLQLFCFLYLSHPFSTLHYPKRLKALNGGRKKVPDGEMKRQIELFIPLQSLEPESSLTWRREIGLHEIVKL